MTDSSGGRDDVVNGRNIGDASDQNLLGLTSETVALDDNGNASIQGSVGFGDDNRDIYTVTAVGIDEAEATLRILSDGVAFDSDGNKERVITLDLTDGQHSFSFGSILGTPETYYEIDINAPGGGSSGNDSPGDGSSDDDSPGGRDDVVNGRNVGDAGDTRSQAALVTLDDNDNGNGNGNASIQGSVGFGGDDADYYTFTAGSSGQANILLSGLFDGVYTQLYNASGNEIESTVADNDNDKVITTNLTGGQDYTVEVDPYRAAESNYDLDISVEIDSTGDSPRGDLEFQRDGDRVYLRHKDSGERQLYVDGGEFTIGEQGLTFTNGTAFAANSEVTSPLFTGTFTLPYTTPGLDVQANGISSSDDVFSIANLPLSMSGVGLTPDGLTIAGELGLGGVPGTGDVGLAYKGEDALLINESNGVQLRGDGLIALPDTQFTVGGAFDLETKGLSAAFDFNADSLEFQGDAVLKTELIPGLGSAEVDFSGENSLRLDDEGWGIDGDLITRDLAIPGTGFKFNELRLAANSNDGEYSGSGDLSFPFTTKDITFGVGLISNPSLSINEISGGIKNLQYPIGSTGAFLQSISGGVDNLNGNEPLSFLGGGALTAGPRVAGASILQADLGSNVANYNPDNKQGNGFEITNDGFNGRGTLTLLDENFLQGTGSIDLDWERKSLEVDATLNALGGAFSTQADLSVVMDPFDLSLGGMTAIAIPDWVGWGLGGRSLAEGNFQLDYNESTPAENALYLWSGIDLPFFGEYEKGIRVPLNDDFIAGTRLVGSKELEQVGSWEVPASTAFITLTASWTAATEAAPGIEIIRPNGVVISEDDFGDYENIAIVEGLSGTTNRTAIVNAPEAGVWDIQLVNETNLGEIEYTAAREGTNAAVTIESVTGTANGGADVAFDLRETTGEERLALFRDNDADGRNGIRIAELSRGEAEAGYTWLPENTEPGEYYLYATLFSDAQVPQTSYADEPVTVDRQTDLSVAVNAPQVQANPGDTVSFEVRAEHLGRGPNATDTALIVSWVGDADVDGASEDYELTEADDLRFDLGELNRGDTAALQLDLSTSPDASRVNVTASVESALWDGNSSNNQASAVVALDSDMSSGSDDQPLEEEDDFELVQRTSPGVLSAGQGDDTYLLSPSTLNGDEELTLQDGQGSNRIQLVEGLQIAASTVATNALRLVLDNGAVINVNGADEFRFETGANAVAGATSANVSFDTFVSETLGLQTPASGTVEGGSLAIGDVSTPPDSAPIGAADDFALLQRTSPGVVSAGQGDDTYILSQNTLNGDENLTLQDGQGSDRIQLVDGLEIARSTVAANALQLELANGSVINVNGADAFSYEPGGNAVAGVDGEDVSFDTFVSETLGTDVPASGTSEGGSVTIGAAGGTPLPVGTSQTVSATDEAETFTLDQLAAAATAADTQIDLEGFDPAADTLEINLAQAFEAPGVSRLDQLDGVKIDGVGNQASVSSNPVTNVTTATLGIDADGDVIVLTLVGLTDLGAVDLAIA